MRAPSLGDADLAVRRKWSGIAAGGAVIAAALVAAAGIEHAANPPLRPGEAAERAQRADQRRLDPHCRRSYQLVREGEGWRPKLRVVCVGDFAAPARRR